MQRALTTVCDLLSSCFSLTSEDLARINLASAELGITQGEFLFREGAVSAHVVRGAILCQLFMQERLLPGQLAISAVQLVSKLDVSIEEALTKLGWDRTYYENIRQMSELLLKSALIDESAKALAYELCFDDRLPFLAALVQRQAITDASADYALTLQHLIMRGSISFDDAVESLKKRKKNAGIAIKDSEVPVNRGIRLGELLVAAGLVTYLQLIAAVEKGRVRGQLVGEILVEDEALSADALEHALAVQSNIDSGVVSVEEGVNELVGPSETFAGGFATR